ncbi:carbonic anhydrase 7-like [Oppia nitens]|uniref:carbonic anhydrase 7-like n=1 Tax=Oppia nitens TaxID=1686743 RepID=UPI0023DBF640|nr:carbonic anhydrase 7-like [Oppia nitens]
MSVISVGKCMTSRLQLAVNRHNIWCKTLKQLDESNHHKLTFRSYHNYGDNSNTSNTSDDNHSTGRSAKKQRPDSSRSEHWYTDYPISLIGKRQSPINIQTNKCLLNNRDLELKPLIIKYPKELTDLVLKNPRDDKFFGWRVDVFNENDISTLSGGPLDHNYRLAQFHCHWGKSCNCGSEHTIDDKQYSAELHFVFWNTDLYTSPQEALHSPHGLSVLAVFLESCDKPNEEMSKLTQLMPQITYKGQKIVVKEAINISNLLPTERSYWTYSGSLTTPPLWETVEWIVFKHPIRCTQQQIDTFRQLSYYSLSDGQSYEANGYECNINDNYRTQQPLNDRTVIFVNKSKSIN